MSSLTVHRLLCLYTYLVFYLPHRTLRMREETTFIFNRLTQLHNLQHVSMSKTPKKYLE